MELFDSARESVERLETDSEIDIAIDRGSEFVGGFRQLLLSEDDPDGVDSVVAYMASAYAQKSLIEIDIALETIEDLEKLQDNPEISDEELGSLVRSGNFVLNTIVPFLNMRAFS